ncbi:Crp/Fnr family transcriptional regulator [Aquimarina longa]|uniref:Crp/Fnr family transcriptional regulator n=1 Tax=Aquimarina longa TaxID=1080221 RepID=UPI000784E807|nr:Crp/Fnr family transcriptional regulator [Aquimarina longa]
MEYQLSLEEELLYSFFTQVYPITKEEFKPIAKVIKKKSYRRGDYILNIGQIETKTSFVIKGIVHQYVIIEDNSFTIDISLAGMSFNCFTSFIESTPSNQIQQAVTDVEIIYLEKKDSEKLLLDSKPFCYIYTKLYEQVHLEREKRSLLLQYKSAYERYKQFLATIVKSKQFLEEVPQKMIADYLSLTPETFSRVKRKYLTNTIS